MFTGKNKEQFDKLFKEGYPNLSFYALPFSMQQGIYQEYLDNIGYILDVEPIFKEDYTGIKHYKVFVLVESDLHNLVKIEKEFPSRQGALTEAFKKADELINN